MKKETLRRVAVEFMTGLNFPSSKDRCYMACAPLGGYLNAFGTPCRITEGRVSKHHHYWITLPDGTIVDPTADQFNDHRRVLPAVYVGPKPAWYKAGAKK